MGKWLLDPCLSAIALPSGDLMNRNVRVLWKAIVFVAVLSGSTDPTVYTAGEKSCLGSRDLKQRISVSWVVSAKNSMIA